MERLEKWLGTEFSTGPTTGEDYEKFQREARADLKAKAAAAGFVVDKFNPNHYCWSARLKHEATGYLVYVSMRDVRFYPWYERILYRRMDDPEDWGSRNWTNSYCTWAELTESLEKLARRF